MTMLVNEWNSKIKYMTFSNLTYSPDLVDWGQYRRTEMESRSHQIRIGLGDLIEGLMPLLGFIAFVVTVSIILATCIKYLQS